MNDKEFKSTRLKEFIKKRNSLVTELINGSIEAPEVAFMKTAREIYENEIRISEIKESSLFDHEN